ncbi:hypothetical protein BKA62DRAFT_769315 [Auriculariales sp. MPI-PUGE-AT-0066]|nr:hypothetical protein BKA62DRAFT_769315 [Auriculariales sp. MPI-PUGE-AT-0066]
MPPVRTSSLVNGALLTSTAANSCWHAPSSAVTAPVWRSWHTNQPPAGIYSSLLPEGEALRVPSGDDDPYQATPVPSHIVTPYILPTRSPRVNTSPLRSPAQLRNQSKHVAGPRISIQRAATAPHEQLELPTNARLNLQVTALGASSPGAPPSFEDAELDEPLDIDAEGPDDASAAPPLLQQPPPYLGQDRRATQDEVDDRDPNNAMVWQVYRERVSELDKDLLEGWDNTLTILLVFAGLFSAVATAFLIEAQPDFAEYTAVGIFAVLAQLNSSIITPPPLPDLNNFKASNNARWVSGLWFVSLTLSLVVSLLAILVKQWIVDYTAKLRAPIESTRRWAWRHFAFNHGLSKYGLGFIISSLTAILHMALFLFLAGLAGFLNKLDSVIYWTTIAVTATVGAFYIGVTLAPLWLGDCPSTTPLVSYIHTVYLAMVWVFSGNFLPRKRSWTSIVSANRPAFHEEMVLDGQESRRDLEILTWMLTSLPLRSDVNMALEAFGSINVISSGDAAVQRLTIHHLTISSLSALMIISSPRMSAHFDASFIVDGFNTLVGRRVESQAELGEPWRLVLTTNHWYARALSAWGFVLQHFNQLTVPHYELSVVFRAYSALLEHGSMFAFVDLSHDDALRGLEYFLNRGAAAQRGHSWAPACIITASKLLNAVPQEGRPVIEYRRITWQRRNDPYRQIFLEHITTTPAPTPGLADLAVSIIKRRGTGRLGDSALIDPHLELCRQIRPQPVGNVLDLKSELSILQPLSFVGHGLISETMSAWRVYLIRTSRWKEAAEIAEDLAIKLSVLAQLDPENIPAGISPLQLFDELAGGQQAITLASADYIRFVNLAAHIREVAPNWWRLTKETLEAAPQKDLHLSRDGRRMSPADLIFAVEHTYCWECTRAILHIQRMTKLGPQADLAAGTPVTPWYLDLHWITFVQALAHKAPEARQLEAAYECLRRLPSEFASSDPIMRMFEGDPLQLLPLHLLVVCGFFFDASNRINMHAAHSKVIQHSYMYFLRKCATLDAGPKTASLIERGLKPLSSLLLKENPPAWTAEYIGPALSLLRLILKDDFPRRKPWSTWLGETAFLLAVRLHEAQIARTPSPTFATGLTHLLQAVSPSDRDVHTTAAQQLRSWQTVREVAASSPMNLAYPHKLTGQSKPTSTWDLAFRLNAGPPHWATNPAQFLVIQLALLEHPRISDILQRDDITTTKLLHQLVGGERGVTLAIMDSAAFLDIAIHARMVSDAWWMDGMPIAGPPSAIHNTILHLQNSWNKSNWLRTVSNVTQYVLILLEKALH